MRTKGHSGGGHGCGLQDGLADTLRATIVIPYPGAPLFDECKENDWLKTNSWEEYDMRGSVMRSPMGEEEIKELTQGLYKVFLTPRYVLRKIASIRGMDDLVFVKKGIAAVAGHLKDFSQKKS